MPSSEHATALAGVRERCVAELPRDREVVAYCRGPYRVYSDEAAAMLQRHGFTVRRLEEGFPEWRAAGLPVEVGAPPEQTAIKSPHRQLQDKG